MFLIGCSEDPEEFIPLEYIGNIIIDSEVELPRVFVDYAHTPDALENVSETLFNIKKEDEVLVIVFGCGGASPSKINKCAASEFQLMLLTA